MNRTATRGRSRRSASAALEEGAHWRWYLLAAGIVLLMWFSMGAVRAMRGLYALACVERPGRLRRPFAAARAFNGGVALLIALSRGGSMAP